MPKTPPTAPHPSAPRADSPEGHGPESRTAGARPAAGSKKLTVAAGAAMGIGSAALVAALLYANRRAHRNGHD